MLGTGYRYGHGYIKPYLYLYPWYPYLHTHHNLPHSSRHSDLSPFRTSIHWGHQYDVGPYLKCSLEPNLIGGCRIFFSRPVAGLTNRGHVRDFRAGAPLIYWCRALQHVTWCKGLRESRTATWWDHAFETWNVPAYRISLWGTDDWDQPPPSSPPFHCPHLTKRRPLWISVMTIFGFFALSKAKQKRLRLLLKGHCGAISTSRYQTWRRKYKRNEKMIH